MRLGDPGAIRERVGVKAANLSILAAAGFPVPEGFVVPVDAVGSPEDALREAVDLAMERLGGVPVVAVRSSGVAEDLADASFAGQYETFLDVRTTAGIVDAVRRCWASASADRVTSYRSGTVVAPLAVLVQRMVDAACAGVAFSADPLTGDRSVVRVSAVLGLGERLVSGQAPADEWEVRGSSAKRLSATENAMTKAQALAIAKLTRRVELFFGSPQDIEWAIAKDGRLHLLQARPITALPEQVSWDPPVRGAFSRNFRLGEWIGAPVTPLFEDWLLGRIEDRLHERHAEWVGMRGIRPYHVVLNGWYFYSLEFLPVTLRGMARSLPSLMARLISAPRRVVVASPQFARFGVPLYEKEWREELLPRYRNAVQDATLGVAQTPLDGLPEIIDRLADIAGDYFASMAIVAGYAYKAETNLALWYWLHLRRLGESHLPLLLGLTTAPAEPAGHIVENLDWWYPTVGERTPTVEAAVPNQDLAEVVSRLETQRLAATSRVHQALRSQRKRRTFDRLLAEAQHSALVREEQVAAFTLAWPLFRIALRRLGDALVAAGTIDAPDDVYFLKRSELDARTASESAGLQTTVAERRTARERATQITAPLSAGRFSWLVRGLMNARSAFGARTRSDALLHGAPASPGLATAAVRVIRDLAAAGRLQQGEILVAPMTTPAWTPLFRIASGVVTDVGNAMSHASIVAREYGIPCIVGCGNATARLTDGECVTVDGAAGTVIRAVLQNPLNR